MNDPTWVNLSALSNYQVAPDGSSVRLNAVDADGGPVSVIVPMQPLRELAFTMPKIVTQAMQAAAGSARSDDQRLVHLVQHWKLEGSQDPGFAILTIAMPDQFEISFALQDRTLAQMAELMGEYHIEAFPQGLKFH